MAFKSQKGLRTDLRSPGVLNAPKPDDEGWTLTNIPTTEAKTQERAVGTSEQHISF